MVISQAQGDPLTRPPAHIRPGRPAFIAEQTEGRVIKIVIEEREIEGAADIIQGEHLGYEIDLVPFVVSRVEFVFNHLLAVDLQIITPLPVCERIVGDQVQPGSKKQPDARLGRIAQGMAQSLAAVHSLPSIGDIEGQHVVHFIVGAASGSLP